MVALPGPPNRSVGAEDDQISNRSRIQRVQLFCLLFILPGLLQRGGITIEPLPHPRIHNSPERSRRFSFWKHFEVEVLSARLQQPGPLERVTVSVFISNDRTYH
jgi:hypothetical protein